MAVNIPAGGSGFVAGPIPSCEVGYWEIVGPSSSGGSQASPNGWNLTLIGGGGIHGGAIVTAPNNAAAGNYGFCAAGSAFTIVSPTIGPASGCYSACCGTPG